MTSYIPKSTSPTKRALVIGNNNYDRSVAKLRHCVNDADDLSTLLNKIGFKVTTQHNLTNQELIEIVYDFAKTIVDGDLVMFYFAGHGYSVDSENYLISVDDINIETDGEVEDYAFKVNRVIDRLAKRNKSYVSIFILDCCRPYWPAKTPRKPGSYGSIISFVKMQLVYFQVIKVEVSI